MIPRALLVVVCFLWMAYQSHFSTTFFFDMVRASLVDMDEGLQAAMNHEVDRAPDATWRTASTQ